MKLEVQFDFKMAIFITNSLPTTLNEARWFFRKNSQKELSFLVGMLCERHDDVISRFQGKSFDDFAIFSVL